MSKRYLLIISMAVFFLSSNLAVAQDKKDTDKKTDEPVAYKDFKAITGLMMNRTQDKFVALAEAFPQDKYSWRPGKGVRSVEEVFIHMIQANYGLPNVYGVKTPEDVPKDMSKMTEKKEIIAWLKNSFEHTRNSIKDMSAEDLDKDITFFGANTNYRGVVFVINTHANQHLGQLIAYSRMNGIVPPWSEDN